MKEKLTSLLTVFSAFIMSGCCLGPLILIPLGLTNIAGALAIFSRKYEIVLMVITFLLLAISFYFVYGSKCKKKSSIIILWISTALTVGMFIYILVF